MLSFKILPKFSIVIIGVFILFTIAGTLLHELGHIVVGQYLGYDTVLDYGSANLYQKGYLEDEDLKEINRIVEQNGYNNYQNWPKPMKLKVKSLSQSLNKKYPPISDSHALAFTIGGPIQTILTSIVGLLLLYTRRNKWHRGFTAVDWIGVILSLFILREIFNFLSALYSWIVASASNFNGDEFKISQILGYNEWLIPSIAFVFSLYIALFVIFKIVPFKYRFSFIVSGFIGGSLGYSLWFGFLGAFLFNSEICF